MGSYVIANNPYSVDQLKFFFERASMEVEIEKKFDGFILNTTGDINCLKGVIEKETGCSPLIFKLAYS